MPFEPRVREVVSRVAITAAIGLMATACAQPYVLAEDADVDVVKLMSGDQLSQSQIIYGYVDSPSEIYIDKTVGAAGGSTYSATGPMCGSQFAEALVCGPLALLTFTTIVVLAAPLIAGAAIANLMEDSKTPKAVGSASAVSSSAVAVPPPPLDPAYAQVPQWFRAFQGDDQLHSSLDDNLISALDATLRQSRQTRALSTGGRAASVQVRAGISHIALLNLKAGGQLLIVCGRLTVYPSPDSYRTYETCQSEKLEHALSDVTQMRAALTSSVHRMGQAKHELLAGKRDSIPAMGGERPWSVSPGEDLVNCVANGQRQWTYRSKCD